MNLGGTQTFNHSRLSPSLSQCPYLLFYREKRRHMAETTSNSYHQNENISCMWCCHFFLPLQHKMGAFLYLLKTDLTLHPWRPPGQKSHNLLSSSPVLKFTLLLAPSQEHLNLLISCLLKKHQKPKTQTKKNPKQLSLRPSISLQRPPSLLPHFKATFSNSRIYLLSPFPHSSHHCSSDFTPTPMKLLTEFMKWHQKSNRHFQALSFFLLSIQHPWTFDFFKNSLPLAFVMPTPLIDNLAFPVSHSQLSLLVPPSLLDYYTFVFQALDFILPTLFLRDLTNSQISDTIYVQNSLQIFIFSQGCLRNSRRFCSNMYFLLTQMPNSHSKTMCI